MELEAFKQGVSVKQLIVGTFRKLELAYKAGASGDKAAAREYHYMQVASALDTLDDYPSWRDIEELQKNFHGFGPKSMAKLAELWSTGRLKLSEELGSRPEQVAAEQLMRVHGIGRSRALELVAQGVRSVEDLRWPYAVRTIHSRHLHRRRHHRYRIPSFKTADKISLISHPMLCC